MTGGFQNREARIASYKTVMTFLSPDEVLFHAGSLISTDGNLVAPYDLEYGDAPLTAHYPSTHLPGVKNANAEAFRIDWRDVSTVHVVNGMGVTLGDSIIGLTAIHAIKARFPHVRFHLYRPTRAPEYVHRVYGLATGLVIDQCEDLPLPVSRLPSGEIVIDVGNHLFWSRFADTPMIDFFLDALGTDPGTVAPSDKQNGWLSALPRQGLRPTDRPYAIFAPFASTPLRSIPTSVHYDLVDVIARRYGLPVLGFAPVQHPLYIDVTKDSVTTDTFLEFIRDASFVMTSDTAAVHIAAGFKVPTTAFFSSIEPELRVRDYENCTAIKLEVPSLRSLQASGRDADLQLLEDGFRKVVGQGLELPSIRQ